MRKILLPLLALTILAADAFSQRGRGRFGRNRNRNVELKHFTMKRVTFPTVSMNTQMDADVYLHLPKEYDDPANKNKRYPWVIWLHGMNENGSRFHYNGAAIMDRLLGEKKIPPMIMVAPSGPRSTLYVNRERSGDVEDLIVIDLVKFMEKNYRVAKDRSKRALMGVSIGGHGAMKMALKFRKKFGHVATHSAAIMPANPNNLPPRYERYARFSRRGFDVGSIFGNPIDIKKWSREMPFALAKDMKLEHLKSIRMYFDAGTDDRYGFAPLNQDYSKMLKKRGVPHTFRLIDGGGHSWGTGSVQRQLPISLKFIGDGFRMKKKAASRPTTRRTDRVDKLDRVRR